MKLRRLLAPALAGALLLAPAVASAGVIPNDDSIADPTGDSGGAKAIDITSLTVTRTDTDYRAKVSYDGLFPQNSDRWFVAFIDSGVFGKAKAQAPRSLASALAAGNGFGNVVEMRRNPDGVQKSVAYDITNIGDDGVQRSTCAGVRTSPNYAKKTIQFIVPEECWNATSGTVLAFAGTKRYTRATWNGTEVPTSMSSNGKSDQTDQPLFWAYDAPTSGGPSPSAAPKG